LLGREHKGAKVRGSCDLLRCAGVALSEPIGFRLTHQEKITGSREAQTRVLGVRDLEPKKSYRLPVLSICRVAATLVVQRS
jgi:hypothetical protein